MAVLETGISKGSFYDLSRSQNVFSALGTLTGQVAYTATAGMGCPLLWNNTGPSAGGTNGVVAVILGLSIGWTTAPSATGVMGIAVGHGQTAAPTSTSAISLVGCLNSGGATPLCNTYIKGTVANAASAFFPTHSLSTAGTPSDGMWVPLDGLVQVGPGGWAAVCASATIASMVSWASLVWAEVPI